MDLPSNQGTVPRDSPSYATYFRENDLLKLVYSTGLSLTVERDTPALVEAENFPGVGGRGRTYRCSCYLSRRGVRLGETETLIESYDKPRFFPITWREKMRVILVRIGVDQVFGHWNAPVDTKSRRFVYVPIPEDDGTRFRPGLERKYKEFLPALQQFSADFDLDLEEDLGFSQSLLRDPLHLDPDFEWLTYGDNGDKRGSNIKEFNRGDLVVFYAGLRPIQPHQELLYALVGLYVVDEVKSARKIAKSRWQENAHTRKLKIGGPDIVVRAKKGVSGRLSQCIPIGEWRNGAYRVRKKLLKKWGGLTVKDGFIQRSARPPLFLKPKKFYRWFLRQNIELTARNN